MIPVAAGTPGLWRNPARGMRTLQNSLLEKWEVRGYEEVIPPLLIPEGAARSASPEALRDRTLPVTANGEGMLSLRSDFTAGVAWMAACRRDTLPDPLRLCYSGTVVRRPTPDRPEGLETYQAGCERICTFPDDEGDEEIALLAAETLTALGLEETILELGHWGLVGPLLKKIPWPESGKLDLERALNRKSISAIEDLGHRHGKAREWELLGRLIHLGGRPKAVDALEGEMRALGVFEPWETLRKLEGTLTRIFPELRVRLDLTDTRHWSYYTGLTLKAFSRCSAYAVLSGGRYDALLPSLGKPLGACGFAVYLSRLMKE